MIVLNGIQTICVDVVEVHGLVSFIQEASEMMTGFCSMSAGEKMRFPTVEIADKVLQVYREQVNSEKGLIVIKVMETLQNNLFEVWINIIIPPKIIDIRDTEFMAECKKLMTFSAVPERTY